MSSVLFCPGLVFFLFFTAYVLFCDPLVGLLWCRCFVLLVDTFFFVNIVLFLLLFCQYLLCLVVLFFFLPVLVFFICIICLVQSELFLSCFRVCVWFVDYCDIGCLEQVFIFPFFWGYFWCDHLSAVFFLFISVWIWLFVVCDDSLFWKLACVPCVYVTVIYVCVHVELSLSLLYLIVKIVFCIFIPMSLVLTIISGFWTCVPQ